MMLFVFECLLAVIVGAGLISTFGAALGFFILDFIAAQLDWSPRR